MLLWRFTRSPSMSSCERTFRSGDYQRGVKVCLDSYARTGSEHDLSWVAQAHMYLGQLTEAESDARQLLAGPLYGEGYRILSNVMLQRGEGYEVAARTHATLAVFAHQFTGDERALTSDYFALAQATWMVGDFMASLEAADEALKLSRQLNDPPNEVAAQLARADALRRMGDLRSAADALTGALARATKPCDVAWIRLKMGMREMEDGEESQAKLELGWAQEANAACRRPDISMSVAVNQAKLLRREDAAAARARLDEVTRSKGEVVETLLQYGYLAADRGDLGEADRYLTKAASLDPPDPDWPWEIARARAELFELRGGIFGDLLAELYYRQSMAMVASLRKTARARSAYFVSSHRGPYDGLIALLARTGRWRDALAVVLELDASDMLRATAAQVAVRDDASREPNVPAEDIIAPPPATIDDVLSAWRSRDLVILIAPSSRQIGPGIERVYRLRILHGEVTGEDLGDAGTVRNWATALFADPNDRKAARALGPMIVPPGTSDETLHVLGIGPLGKVPLAALRNADGSPIIARRPLARVLALRATAAEARGTSPPVVMADPRGDLFDAAMEGRIVAAALGPGAQLSGARTTVAATRDRLWAARDAELLHVATHVVSRGNRRALRLADVDVDPAEMV
ncbi:MAG TPA: CHAT domain-containing protein, partial [Kofleriaceae bacterium]|nr:CHAT domain-containing protein [Kofleriaceae bacterium]